ncbi:MAG: 4-hydroxy-tetrahydrodipicolinate synthase [Nitrososphaeria archaeon]|nr:4-hydroxy-tetrahydrodipicolinate synthase [Nitrososphaeria archaeon]NIN53024.1 4-hydroxy-tetrahydrodipicolinate synthase [Nitrososphaeria archaeon]NIQ33583.1 4-hydroxy-tetrahydrodipicolinate synthase [Nitrososphaeria archaeon]
MPFEPKGIIVAMVTPFRENEALNEEGAREIIRHLLDGGVHGVFALGSQGEFWALSMEEKRRLLEVTVDEVNGKADVYAGTGVESTRETIELMEIAEDIGVDAASIITPYYVRPSSRELVDHYKTIASKVDLPILLYNNPARTGVNINAAVLSALTKECSNIVGIKDSSGNLTTTLEYITSSENGISVLAGRDTLIYATLAYGGQGSIAACANVAPKIVVKIYKSFVSGDHNGALKAQRELTSLRMAFALGTFPVVVKEALDILGLPAGPCRKPVLPLTPENRERLREVLIKLNLL